MSLVGNPIPPLDHVPHAGGAPPGIAVDLDAYDQDWVNSRPYIIPRIGVVHTNGGGGEGTIGGAIAVANSKPNAVKPHYNFNAPQPTKHLATDRRAIANSTPRSKELEYGVPDSSFWTIAFETADRGYNNGGNADLGDFLYDHDELVARAIAYESIVWDIPIVVPAEWVGTGWVTHTSPWDGVYTIYRGKSCPGATKKTRVLGPDWNRVDHDGGEILARAREIYDAWTGNTPDPFPLDPPVEIPMHVLKTPQRIFDTRDSVPVDGTVTVSVPAEMLPAEALLITVTAVRPSGKGYVSVGATVADNGASCLNFNSDNIANTTAVRLSDGEFKLFTSTSTDVLVDVVGRVL